MPKLKTNRGAAKRFKVLGNGQFKHRSANRNHILTKKATGRKLDLRGMRIVDPSDQERVSRLLKLS